MGSISIRESIRWLPDAAEEPTSTVVLTSPNRRFVDIRILKPKNADSSWPANEEPISPDQVDWIIAGTSSSWETDQGVTRGQWRHWIDSRTKETDGLADEGDMFPQSNGSILEKGKMVNPATGKDTDYEEVWCDPKPESTTNGTVRTVVLELDEEGVKGLVVLVGQYCQGFLRRGDSLVAERWQWTKADGWRRVIVLGLDALPCADLLRRTSIREGETVRCSSGTWKATEVSEG